MLHDRVEIVSLSDIMEMNLGRRHRRTLQRIFEAPRRSDVEWRQVMALLEALGAGVSKGRGSRVRVVLNGVRAVFHRPHPRKEMDKGSLGSMERFLTTAGIEPQED
jgi:hypothetical protein